MDWIRTDERFPETNVKVVIYSVQYKKQAMAYWSEEGNWTDSIRPEKNYGGVTHWKPQDPPPLEE